MKFKSIKRWKLGPETEGLLFFAQRLDELLWDFTLDTHKPSTLNAPFLCLEAVRLTRDIEAQLIEAANLKPVLEELIWSVQNDPVSKALLDVPIEQYVLQYEGVKLSDQRLRLEVLGRTLDKHRYLHECFDQLCEQVRRVEKKKIDHTARTMVTTLLNMGMSKRYIFYKNVEYFFSPEGGVIEGGEDLRPFLNSIYPFSHEFRIYFIVSSLVNKVKDSVGPFRVELLKELPDDVREIADANSFVKGVDEDYVMVGPLPGLDVYSAQENAASRLDNLSDLFTLFYHQRKICWRPQAIVKQCCLDKPVMVTLMNGGMEKPFDLPPEKASKELNRLLRNFRANRPSFDKFNRVADLHGICVSTDIVENQLVNLWTALETLIPSHTGGSKIVNIIDSMIPFLMAAYVRRLVQRVSHDLVVWKRWTAKAILNKVPEHSGSTALAKTMALLCIKSNQVLRNELYTELGDFQLLRFRVFQLSDMLSNPDKLRSALKLHEDRVRWQIRRIYRTRNLIVHSGSRPTYIHSLIENGHDYLDQVLFDVMKLCCGEYRTSTLSQAFELARVRYIGFKEKLGSIQTFDATNCQFLCEDYDSLTDLANEAWGRERTSGVVLPMTDRRSPRAIQRDDQIQ